MAEKNDLIFREVQAFSLWLRLLLVLSMALAVAISGFALRETITQPKTPNVFVPILLTAVAMAIPIAAAILFLIIKLETEVRSDGLYVRFYPIHIRYKKFTADNLQQYYTRRYRPILEYGGWGIRYSFTKKGKAYNISGNKGVQLVLKNGKKLLIGSQRPDELVAAIDQMLKK